MGYGRCQMDMIYENQIEFDGTYDLDAEFNICRRIKTGT